LIGVFAVPGGQQHTCAPAKVLLAAAASESPEVRAGSSTDPEVDAVDIDMFRTGASCAALGEWMYGASTLAAGAAAAGTEAVSAAASSI